jgi:DNA polymerase-1
VTRGELRPRLAAALRDNAEQLRIFKRVATLQRIDVSPAPDHATDFAGGARAAAEHGMQRLAARLERAARA